jgi:CubicO group peptidase (beta-lactamase class C family)
MPNAPAWLAPALAYLPEWLSHQMRISEQPGVVFALAHRGTVLHESAFGHANLATGEKLTPRHRFRVASHSKSFTAAAMLRLREQGRLKLDDAAGQYVDGLHPAIAAATISQLLSHTAGILRDGPDSEYWAGRKEFLDAGQLRAELTLPPPIDANTRFKYSNHGFGLAGLVIEAVTGEPYTSWVAREIVARAGLEETAPDVPLPSGKLASGHSSKTLLGRRVIFPGDQSTHALASATGFISTAADLTRFYAQLAPTARSRLLSPSSRREMTRPQWRDAYNPVERAYGLGTIHGAHGEPHGDWAWWGHSGGFQGYITQTAHVPAHDLTLSMLTNAVDGWSHLWLDGALSILKRFASEGAPAASVADWSGRWWSGWGAIDLVPMGRKILAASPALAQPFQKVPELTPTGPDTARITLAGGFASHGEPVSRRRDKRGRVTSVQLASGTFLSEAAAAKDLAVRYGEK